MPYKKHLERIHRIWDELADFEASRTEAALDYLLDQLCHLCTARTGFWLGALRLNDKAASDPLLGWRPRVLHYLHNTPERQALMRQRMNRLESGPVDPSMSAHVARAGDFRALLQRELVGADWFESDFYLEMKATYGLRDRLFVVTPINPDTEAYIALDRLEGQSPFTAEDRDIAAYTLRGLRWFQRQVALFYGVELVDESLTPVERRILLQLLTDKSEAAIARELGYAQSTTHTYVTRILRKFGVRGRAGLTALWLGKPVDPNLPEAG